MVTWLRVDHEAGNPTLSKENLIMRHGVFAMTVATIVLFSTAIAADQTLKTIYDGTSGKGWMTNNGKPLPKANVQTEGLNPHNSGGYIVVHEKPRGDFVLDFDYKLTKGCNSGVFLRVGNLK